jgi:hypothetical protein
MSPTRDCSLRSMLLPAVSPADQSSELGPRSLDPAALFGARLPSLFEARRRLPTSAIHITTCGQPNPSSCDPRRDDGLDRLPFLEPVTPLPCGSGDERRAALRSFVSAPVPVSSHLRGFARPRYQLERPTIPDCSVMHSEDQRARVEGPSEGRVPWRLRRSLVPASGAYALWRMPTNVPLLGDLLDIRCHRRACLQRRIPPPAHGPTEALVPTMPREEHCLPEDQDAFHRHDTRRIRGLREGIAPSGLRAGSPAHAAHTFPPVGAVLLMGIASVTVRSPAWSVTGFESANAFLTRWNCRAWA